MRNEKSNMNERIGYFADPAKLMIRDEDIHELWLKDRVAVRSSQDDERLVSGSQQKWAWRDFSDLSEKAATCGWSPLVERKPGSEG